MFPPRVIFNTDSTAIFPGPFLTVKIKSMIAKQTIGMNSIKSQNQVPGRKIEIKKNNKETEGGKGKIITAE